MSARPSCANCARKHLAQAMVLMLEAEKGYPAHAWLAIGHLAEAEDELLDQHPSIAQSVRAHRLLYQETVISGQKHYSFPGFELIAELGAFDVAAPPDPVAFP